MPIRPILLLGLAEPMANGAAAAITFALEDSPDYCTSVSLDLDV